VLSFADPGSAANRPTENGANPDDPPLAGGIMIACRMPFPQDHHRPARPTEPRSEQRLRVASPFDRRFGMTRRQSFPLPSRSARNTRFLPRLAAASEHAARGHSLSRGRDGVQAAQAQRAVRRGAAGDVRLPQMRIPANAVFLIPYACRSRSRSFGASSASSLILMSQSLTGLCRGLALRPVADPFGACRLWPTRGDLHVRRAKKSQAGRQSTAATW